LTVPTTLAFGTRTPSKKRFRKNGEAAGDQEGSAWSETPFEVMSKQNETDPVMLLGPGIGAHQAGKSSPRKLA